MARISNKARELALAIWAEQVANGIGDGAVDEAMLDEWLANRAYSAGLRTLEAAAEGDIEALTEVRVEAGLDPIV